MNPRQILHEMEIHPRKSLGQNFLHDPNMLEKIVATAELMPDDTVVEIGPGTGALTALLAQSARHVIAVEVDERLRPVLEEQLAPYPNVHLIFNDILKTNLLEIVGPGEFVVVANLPYYITSPILMMLLEPYHRPRRIVVTVQYEMAERVLARPGDMNRMAVMVQFYGQARIITRMPPAVFWPRPEVDSAVLRIDPYSKPPVNVPDNISFARVVKAGFSMKRKQLKNALSGGLQLKTRDAVALLEQAGIDPTRRAETLTLEEWAALSRALPARPGR